MYILHSSLKQPNALPKGRKRNCQVGEGIVGNYGAEEGINIKLIIKS